MNATTSLNSLTTSDWRQARAERAALIQACLGVLGAPSGAAVLADPKLKITTVLTHAGNGTRWIKSLTDDPALAKASGVTPDDPRGFALVDNLLTDKPERVPVITYAYYGVKSLMLADGQPISGRRHITYHRRTADIERFQSASELMGVTTEFLQPTPAQLAAPTPGHAAVLCEILDELADADIIVTQFGSDPVAPATVNLGVLTLAALQHAGEAVGVILPTAPHGAYPVSVDEAGLVRGMSHNKLDPMGQTEGVGWSAGGSNVGLRMYSGPRLREILEAARRHHARNGQYTPEGGEYSLDHVDAQFAAAGLCRQLQVASDAEAHPAKSADLLTDFIASERELLGL